MVSWTSLICSHVDMWLWRRVCDLNVLLSGDLYFEKAVNGFLSDLFAKWKVCEVFLFFVCLFCNCY